MIGCFRAMPASFLRWLASLEIEIGSMSHLESSMFFVDSPALPHLKKGHPHEHLHRFSAAL